MDQVIVRAWGNSYGIRIPKKMLEEMNLNVSDKLDVCIEDNSIVLRKVFQHKSFEERLAEYSNKISIYDFDWGKPEGREMF